VVDVFAAVAPVTVVGDRFADARGEGALWGGEFEGEDEVGDCFEVGSDCTHFVDEIFETDDISADVLFDLCVGFDGHAFLADFPEQFFVDELADKFLVGFAPGDVVFNALEEADVGWGAFEEDCGVYLFEVEFGEDEFLLASDVCDSSDSQDNKEFADSVGVGEGTFEGELLILFALSGGEGTLSL
jgi:hypothetical protein